MNLKSLIVAAVATASIVPAFAEPEFVDVARRKMRWEWDDVVAMLAAFRAWFGTPVPLTHETHVLALKVARRRGLRIYDALVLSAAKQAGCRILYTEDLQDGQAWIAYEFDGEPLDPEHGGPARLLVPHLYFWKSAKWVQAIDLREDDEPGFWESLGYHNYGDPWREQRYWGD